MGQRWQYQVWDAKLAKTSKPHHVIQLCCYAEMIAAMWPGDPVQAKLVLDAATTVTSVDILAVAPYYRSLKSRFALAV